MTLFGKKNYVVEAVVNGRRYSHKFRSEAGALRFINSTLCEMNDAVTDVIVKNENTTEYYSNDSTRFFVTKTC